MTRRAGSTANTYNAISTKIDHHGCDRKAAKERNFNATGLAPIATQLVLL
jgi:hypothetical protein